LNIVSKKDEKHDKPQEVQKIREIIIIIVVQKKMEDDCTDISDIKFLDRKEKSSIKYNCQKIEKIK